MGRERLADLDEEFQEYWRAAGFVVGGADGRATPGAQQADGSWNLPVTGWPFGDEFYIRLDTDTGAADLVRR